ncbi:MAG: hypothetical protein GY854_25085 [Deltaproteobacteria bacterium]|nr:hypothetical protein [Deltaproteobacteria bacterium]
MARETSIVGDLINFRGLVYAPMNENGVIYLFGKVTNELHMYVEEIKPGYPDCIARRFSGRGWERIRVEFEYKSTNFRQHGHDPENCDLIVCWEHDWKDCPLEVIELKTEIQDMEDIPIQRPTPTKDKAEFEQTMSALFDRVGTQEPTRDWWAQIQRALVEHDEAIWFNIGKKYAGIYSPKRAFASLKPSKSTLLLECFTRGEELQSTKVCSKKYSPRWGRFIVKSPEQVVPAIEILMESRRRLIEAVEAGESTGFYSGGQGFKKKELPDEDTDDESQNGDE